MLQVKYSKGLHFWMDAKWNRDITSDLIIDFRVRGLWTWSWCKHSRNPCVEAVWRDYDASNRVFSITRVGLFFVATQNTSSSITHITIKQLSRPAISLFHYTELSNVCKQFQSNRLCLRVCHLWFNKLVSASAAVEAVRTVRVYASLPR